MSRFIKKLHLKNLLSFDDCEIELQDLNVLIGANGAGKSNLIESIGLLRSLVFDHAAYLRQGGGPAAWIWKGQDPETATVTSTMTGPDDGELVHEFRLDSAGVLLEESLHSGVHTEVFNRTGDELWLNSVVSPFNSDRSVFHQHRSPTDRGPTTQTGQKIESIRIYREFRTGKNDSLRIGNSGSGANAKMLSESGDNLASVLHEYYLSDHIAEVVRLVEDLNPAYRNVKARNWEGLWHVQLHEEGLLDPIPSQRISDGTLKFLCLAALLLNPDPPPLICLEEPEVGLHPEALRTIGKLLLQAAERTQLIVTTHSADLVNELTPAPEAVVVTEKNERHATRFTRLNRKRLGSRLERYQLGELWQKGEIGGNRW